MVHCRNIIVLLMIVSLSGCTTLGSLQRHYERIDFKDGIDRKEARIIAMSDYLQKDQARNYGVGSARVYDVYKIPTTNSGRSSLIDSKDIFSDDGKQLRFPGSWYVVFRPKFLSLFCSYYLVVVDKKDGTVLHEHDSNLGEALVDNLFKPIFQPRIMSALAVGMYYMDKKEVPETVEQLKQYLEQLPEDIRVGFKELEGMKIEKISQTKLKINYAFHGSSDFMEMLSLGDFVKSAYELEIKPQEEKIIMQITGDIKATFELADKTMAVAPSNKK